jgi:hypothetical protein
MPHGIDPFRVPIVAKRPDRSRINVMRQSQQNEPDSRGSSPAMTKESDLDFFKRSPSNRDVISMT